METVCLTLPEVLRELQTASGDAPFLALGQTVFWDEPMKAGVVDRARKLGFPREFVSGIHDTDYFAKLPGGKRKPGKFQTFPHNDTTTRGLWSAAAEFSSLFGSETVISRESLLSAGLRMAAVARARPNFLDEATEAWGWRGVVSLDDNPPIAAEVPLAPLIAELMKAFDWAVDDSLDSLVGEGQKHARKLAEDLRAEVCNQSDSASTLSDFYQILLPVFSEFAVGRHVEQQVTATTELLRFNTKTCGSIRFRTVDLFVNSETRSIARAAYDEAIRSSSGLYELGRFGTGAIPFDLIIPGLGRGTIRLGTRGAVINTPKPQFLSFKKPLTGVDELAALVESKFGPNCVLVGKAVALIGMLAPEFVFMFHEGASAYVKHSRRLHQLLGERLDANLRMNPILRIKYRTWDALSVSCSWLRLPEPFRNPFGTEELCAPSFAKRWREIAHEQESLLTAISTLRRPVDLIQFLDKRLGGSWQRLAEEYSDLQVQMSYLQSQIEAIRQRRFSLYDRRRELSQSYDRVQREMGDHFRAVIFEKSPSISDMEKRAGFIAELERLRHERSQERSEVANLRSRQQALLHDPTVQRVHDRRRAIELEAELKRLRLVRQAIVSSKGLRSAAFRPSAWWFPLVCPDGLWYRETVESAEYYLEPLL